MITPELYKHIVLNQSGEPSNRGKFRWTNRGRRWDIVRLSRLSRALQAPSTSHRSAVASLDLELDSNTLHESLGRSDIMLHLPSLKSLCLSSKRPVGFASGRTLSIWSPSKILRSLQGVSLTLESLIIDIDQGSERRDGSDVGSLGHFVALKHLGIQSHILFGNRDIKSLRYDTFDVALLSKFLPMGLQQLQLSCWTDDLQGWELPSEVVIAFLLEHLMRAGHSTLADLHQIMVYLPAKDRRKHDWLGYFVLTRVTQDWRDRKQECIEYAFEGRWQEMVEMLERTALRMHRTIAVTCERASQDGSRSWSEIARSHMGKVKRMTD